MYFICGYAYQRVSEVLMYYYNCMFMLWNKLSFVDVCLISASWQIL